MRESGEIGITDAAMILKRAYQATRDIVLRGDIKARRDDTGRLWVKRSSVEKYARENLRNSK